MRKRLGWLALSIIPRSNTNKDSSLKFDRGSKPFYFGRLAVGLYVISLVGLAWIGFSYSLFPAYTVPVLLLISFGITGLTLAFAFGAIIADTTNIRLQFITIALFTIPLVFLLDTVTQIFTAEVIANPGLTQSSVVLGLPFIISIAFYGFVGIQEEVFWSSLYLLGRKLTGGKSLWILFIIIAFGGIAFHQAVARQLFIGTIFSAPAYFLWIGMSWILYRMLLELTGHMGVSMLTHFTWNVGVTLINLQSSVIP